MGAYFRTFGVPLGSLFLALTGIWIAAMIIVPQLTMIERAFVFIDRGDDLTVTGTQINRITRDIATIELDIRALEAQKAAPPADATPGGVLPSPSLFPSPTLTPQVAPTLSPALPSPTITTPGIPSPSLVPSPNAAAGGEPLTIDQQIARLQERKEALQIRQTELEVTEQELREAKEKAPRYSFKNFATMSAVHFKIFYSTIFYATLVTVIAFVLCYPIAYAVGTSRSSNKVALLLLALVIPYAINELLRIFAWVMILERQGVLNTALTWLGVFAEGEGPRWVASNWAVFTVMVYAYVLFMVFPLYNTIQTLDRNQIEAARDLGASAWKLHTRVVIPHAKPGIAVGSVMVFMLSAGTIAAPEIVGRGLHPDWFSQVIYRRFFESANWNQGSAYSLMLLISCIVFVLLVMSLFRVSIRDIAK